jgi:hypothetical protein
MKDDPAKIAADLIAYARLGPDIAPEEVFDDGCVLVDWAMDGSPLAWDAIVQVIRSFPEEEFYSIDQTVAQKVGGLTAAGPLEDLISEHGALFIDAIEMEAARDRRFAWALGGVWQSTTPGNIWDRVQRVADYSYWERSSSHGS